MVRDYSLFGDGPTFDERRYPTGHSVGRAEIEAATRIIEKGGLSIYGNREEVSRFEAEFASYVGTEHAVAVTSGTAALHAALQAVGVRPGEKVLVPANIFVAVPQAVVASNAIPRFVDVDPGTLCMTPDAIREAIDDEVGAVVAVHTYGQPADIAAIADLCEDEGIHLVEDAAQACGARYRGDRVGGFGDAGCFSFNDSKNMCTLGEGGMVVTDDEEVATRLRLLRNVGAEGAEGQPLFDANRTRGVNASAVGYNYRMSPIHAAVGRVQLERLDDLNRHRRAIAEIYDASIDGLDELDRQESRPDTEHVYAYYVVEAEDVSRDGVVRALNTENVMSKPYIKKILPDLRMFQRRSGFAGTSMPFDLAETPERYDGDYEHSRHHAKVNFELPMHANVSEEDARQIVALLERIVETFADFGSRASAGEQPHTPMDEQT